MDMKKRESSYIRKSSMVVKGLLVLLMASQVTSVCHTDSQCPGDQVCIIETHTQKSANHKNFKVEITGKCGCARNHIIWKWRCLPRVEKLGDVCVVSLQCPKGQDCHPLSKTCACPLYQPNCDQSFTITSTMASTAGVIVTDALEDLPEHHKKIFHSMLANLNKTWHDSLNSTTNPPPNVSTETEWTSEQIQTIVYVVLALLILSSISIVSGLYMKSISEKRRSAAAIKSLLDLMAENRSLQSVYTMEGVYATATASSQNEVVANSNPKETTHASVMLESRIKLDPIDEEPKLPSPHLSAPTLPPISKRPRPVSQQKIENVDTSSVAAISQNLSTLQLGQRLSAASFPTSEEKEFSVDLRLPNLEK